MNRDIFQIVQDVRSVMEDNIPTATMNSGVAPIQSPTIQPIQPVMMPPATINNPSTMQKISTGINKAANAISNFGKNVGQKLQTGNSITKMVDNGFRAQGVQINR